MGSTGSGRFSDYPGTGKPVSGTAGGSPPPQGEDPCARAFTVTLQDVEHGEFFANNNGAVPPTGAPLRIELRKRVVAVDPLGQSVGNLPTTYNYLADCLQDGFSYEGKVVVSEKRPTATVTVDFVPVS